MIELMLELSGGGGGGVYPHPHGASQPPSFNLLPKNSQNSQKYIGDPPLVLPPIEYWVCGLYGNIALVFNKWPL